MSKQLAKGMFMNIVVDEDGDYEVLVYSFHLLILDTNWSIVFAK